MLARVNPFPVLSAHSQSLTNGSRSDWAARVVIWGVPLVVGGLAGCHDWRFNAPTAVLSGVALLMGALLSTAGVLMTLRLKLTDRDESHREAEQAKRNLDEAVPHVLTAALASLMSAIALILGMNHPSGAQGTSLNVGFSAVVACLLSFVAVLFVATIIRLYAAYVQVNRVPVEMNGFIRRGTL